MENPVDFDIWCTIKSGGVKSAVSWIERLHEVDLSEALKILKNKDGYIQVFKNCGWDDIPECLRNLPEFANEDSWVITESSYSPSFSEGKCDMHKVQLSNGVCPVCNGFYISRVIDGRRILAQKRGS